MGCRRTCPLIPRTSIGPCPLQYRGTTGCLSTCPLIPRTSIGMSTHPMDIHSTVPTAVPPSVHLRLPHCMSTHPTGIYWTVPIAVPPSDHHRLLHGLFAHPTDTHWTVPTAVPPSDHHRLLHGLFARSTDIHWIAPSQAETHLPHTHAALSFVSSQASPTHQSGSATDGTLAAVIHAILAGKDLAGSVLVTRLEASRPSCTHHQYRVSL